MGASQASAPVPGTVEGPRGGGWTPPVQLGAPRAAATVGGGPSPGRAASRQAAGRTAALCMAGLAGGWGALPSCPRLHPRFLSARAERRPRPHLLSPPGLSVCGLSVLRVPLQNLHQLKQIQTLKQMNSQLQAENRALARVVARLSASAEAAPSQGP